MIMPRDMPRETLPRLRLSADRQIIVTETGTPVFILADTAWELIRRADRTDAERYLADRSAKGFNVVQAAVLAKTGGLHGPNVFGDLPFHDSSLESPNERYFEHVDWIVDRAASLGIYIALAPIFGDKRDGFPSSAPEVFTPRSAEVFGEWLGRRYRERPVIWMLGDGGGPETAKRFAIARSMAAGLRKGDGGAHLTTFRAKATSGSAETFPEEDWLDLVWREDMGSHPKSRSADCVFSTSLRPTIGLSSLGDGGPFGRPMTYPDYENAADVRRAFYQSAFNGACGHSYGHQSIWRFCEAGRSQPLKPIMEWREALDQPGAYHVGIGRRLIESRPMSHRVVDEEILEPSHVSPGYGCSRSVALRGAERGWAMIYMPDGRPCDVRLDCLAASSVRAWRFDPRTGVSVNLGLYPAQRVQRFAPPFRGEPLDWILVLDDASRGWKAPDARWRTL